MVIAKLIREYESLTPADQAIFAAAVRAHQVLNSPRWRNEIARRHEDMESGRFAKIDEVAQLVNPARSPTENPAGLGT